MLSLMTIHLGQNMRIFKQALAFSLALSAGAVSDVNALELYVDTNTKQIFSEPGPGRVLLGTFVKSEDAPAKTETPVASAAAD